MVSFGDEIRYQPGSVDRRGVWWGRSKQEEKERSQRK